MTNIPPKKHINVDGILYEVSSGRQLESISIEAKNADVLDLRNSNNSVNNPAYSSKTRSTSRFVSAQPVSRSGHSRSTTTPRPVRATPNEPSRQASAATQASEGVQKDKARASFFSFVMFHGLLPRASLVLWQASIFRAIASPMTWLLLSLPLVLLQFRVLQNLNLNELLQKAKDIVTPENYQAVTVSLGIILSLFLLSLIIRSIITSAGVYVRLREIDNRPVKLGAGIHSAMHSLLRQMLNYIVHFIIILAWSALLIWLSRIALTTSNGFVETSKYQIVVVMAFVWLFIMSLLYTKHWLQIGLLARSNKVAGVQMQSIKLLVAAPLKNSLIGLVGFFISAGSIILIIAMSWLVTDYFIRQKGSPVIAILIVIAIATVFLLTVVQYVQQNIWARQYYFLASISKSRNQLLYMEREKPSSTWPIYVVILLASALVGVYFLLINLYASRLRGELANIHSMIPEEIKLVVPLK